MDGKTAVWIYLDDDEVRTRVLEKAYMKELDTESNTDRVKDSLDSMQEEYLFEAIKFIGSLKTLNYIPLKEEPGEYVADLGFTLSIDADTLEIEFTDLFTHIDYRIIQDKTEAQALLGDNLIQRYYKALKSLDTETDSLLDLYEETFIN